MRLVDEDGGGPPGGSAVQRRSVRRLPNLNGGAPSSKPLTARRVAGSGQIDLKEFMQMSNIANQIASDKAALEGRVNTMQEALAATLALGESVIKCQYLFRRDQ